MMGGGNMKAGNSLQRVMNHQSNIASVPDSGINHPPYFPAIVLTALCFCERFRLISIILQKNPAGNLTASGGEKSPENECFRGGTANKLNSLLTFFYPDYTVDPGVSPGHASLMRVGCTTDRELEVTPHPAPKAFIFTC